MRKLCILAVLLSLLGSSVFAAFSDPIWSSQACRTRSDLPNTNNHDSSKLTVRADNPTEPGAFAQKSWIRFNLSTIDMTDVRAAILTITLMEARYDPTTLEVSAVNDGCNDNDTWTDTNLTWNNAPGNNTASFTSLDPTKTTFLSGLSFTSGAIGDSFDIDVSSAILADTDGIVQFVLHNGNANINFATWDHATAAWRPYLVLEYTPAGADYPSPAIGAKVTTSLSSLSWTLPEPNVPGTPIWCDVYLGTEPNRPQMDKVTLGNNITTVAINTTNFPTFGTLTDNTTYYWFVDCHDSSRLPNPVPGEEWSFETYNNTAPVVDAGADQILWGLPKTVALDATASDDGLPTPTLTYTWTCYSGPTSVIIDSPNTEDTTLQITERGDYNFRLAVSDGDLTTYDTVQVVVGTDACDASHLDTGDDYNIADANEDCLVDIDDLTALILDNWLNCTDTLDNCGF